MCDILCVLGQDPATSRHLAYSLGALAGHPGAGVHPPPHHQAAAAAAAQMDQYYRMASMYPPGSRERLELELDREKRERDARERDIRERELRDLELREKMKQDLEMKQSAAGPPPPPPGYDRLNPAAAAAAAQMDPHWAAELQRRYASQIPPQHLTGFYPPTSIAAASELLNRDNRINELRQLGE